MSNTDQTLSRSAQNVQDALSKKGLEFKVIELSASARTAHEAAETIGCALAQIINCLCFMLKRQISPSLSWQTV